MKTVSVVISTLVIAIIVVVAAFWIYAWSGTYSIGADVPHWNVTYSSLNYFRNRAIKHHAQSVQVPSDLDSPARLGEGAEHYAEMCTGCHLKPGKAGDEMREGLYPKPPDFSRMKHAPDPRMAFWVIKHGIKMTAMPAWGKSHSDEKIWDMVAFVRKLPGMTPAQYQAATAQAAGGDDDHDHEHDSDHDHDHGSHHDHEHGRHEQAGHPPATSATAGTAPAPTRSP